MRRGLFGLMSTAALIASVVTGCSSGGGTASDYTLPELPGATPTSKIMEFSIDDYSTTDNAMLLLTTTGKEETSRKEKDIHITTSYKADVPMEASSVAKNMEVMAEDGDGDGDGDEDTPVDLVNPNIYRCGLYDSVKNFKKLLKNKTNSKGVEPAVAARFDDADMGKVYKVYPPSIVANSGNSKPIYVTKVVDSNDTVNCNILSECDETGHVTCELGDLGKKIAQAFDSGSSFSSKGIYRSVTDLYGTEWRYTPEGGRDGDKRVNIVFCNNEAMSGRYGAVRLCDAFKGSELMTSNSGEFIFVNYNLLVQPLLEKEAGDVDTKLMGTLAHQLAHLIEINSKIVNENLFENFTVGETDALEAMERHGISEGLAEVAEDICGAGVGQAQNSNPDNGGADPISYSDIYAYINPSNSFNGTVSGTNASFKDGIFAVDRGEGGCVNGGSHLFMLYLMKQFGADALTKIMKSPNTGMLNVAKIVETDADKLYHNFNRSVYLSRFSNAPVDCGFEYLKGAGNYVHYNGSVGLYEMFDNVNIYEHKINNEETVTMKPWSAMLVGLESGDNSNRKLTVKVRLPYTSNASLFRMKNGNSFAKEIEGKELPDKEDHQR